MQPITITTANFEEEVINSDKPVLVDFWAVWCGPCGMLSPIVDAVGEEHSEIKVGKINVDEEPALAQRYRVASIPMLLFFKNGEIAGQVIGAVPKETVEDLIAK